MVSPVAAEHLVVDEKAVAVVSGQGKADDSTGLRRENALPAARESVICNGRIGRPVLPPEIDVRVDPAYHRISFKSLVVVECCIKALLRRI